MGIYRITNPDGKLVKVTKSLDDALHWVSKNTHRTGKTYMIVGIDDRGRGILIKGHR